MSLDNLLWFAGPVSEAAVVGLLTYRRVWRTLPFFFIFSVWTFLGSIIAFVVHRNFSPAAYFTTYLTEEGVDFAVLFCVLVELAWSVFRPFRASLPRRTVWVIGILIAAATAAIWPFTDSSAFAHYPMQWHILVRMQQDVSILRVLIFLLLAGCSHLLSIGWRDRELQVATGLGFYSLAALTATVLHAHQAAGQQYRMVELILEACYICSVLYWAASFAQKEALRREFSPKMQSFLLAVAGTARTTRVALADSAAAKTDKHREE
jgi:hypothetical protein